MKENRFPAVRQLSDEIVEPTPASTHPPAAAATKRPQRRDQGDSADEPGSAGLIAHLARLLDQPLASIVNDGGASTLVRQELARKPELLDGKTLVIWEFIERDIRFGLQGWQHVPLPEPG